MSTNFFVKLGKLVFNKVNLALSISQGKSKISTKYLSVIWYKDLVSLRCLENCHKMVKKTKASLDLFYKFIYSVARNPGTKN